MSCFIISLSKFLLLGFSYHRCCMAQKVNAHELHTLQKKAKECLAVHFPPEESDPKQGSPTSIPWLEPCVSHMQPCHSSHSWWHQRAVAKVWRRPRTFKMAWYRLCFRGIFHMREGKLNPTNTLLWETSIVRVIGTLDHYNWSHQGWFWLRQILLIMLNCLVNGCNILSFFRDLTVTLWIWCLITIKS